MNHKYLGKLRASLSFVSRIDQEKVIVRSLGASGILKKVHDKYMAN